MRQILVIAVAAIALGCGGSSGGGGTATGVYTSLVLAASSGTAYQFGTPTTLTLTPKDQNGATLLSGGASPTWHVSDPAKVAINFATVQVLPGATGLVTISADFTLQSITKTSNAVGVTVDLAAAGASVAGTGSNTFNPTPADIKVGGTVTWSGLTTSTGHNVHFSTITPFNGGTTSSNGAPGSSASAAVTFNAAGSFSYQCDRHGPGMVGTVRVH